MKKLISILLSLCIFLCSVCVAFAGGFNQPLWTETYLVVDMEDKTVLAESNSEVRMYPASLTKMITAIIAYEFYSDPEANGYNCQEGLQTKIYASDYAVEQEPTKFGLKLGEEMTVDQAIKIMLLISANDIAVMLAENIAGTEENFARMMNDKAEEIGCRNTHFVTANGLHDDEHYSTASDLAKIAFYLLDIDYLADVVCMPSFDYEETNKHDAGTAYNTNLLMSDVYSIYVGAEKRDTAYDGKVLGVKTGTTPEAGGCLIAAVEKNGLSVLVVILNSRYGDSYQLERYADAHKLLDWVFNNYKQVQYAAAGDSYGTVRVKHGEFNKVEAVLSDDVAVRLPAQAETSVVTTEIKMDESVKAPFEAGQTVGQLHIFLAGDEIDSIPIVTASAVARGGILSVFGVEDAAAHKIFKGIGIALLVILILFAALMVLRAYNKRKARLRKEAKARRRAELERQKKEEWNRDYERRYEQPEEPEKSYYITDDEIRH